MIDAEERKDFIRREIDADLESGRYPKVVTRFPPEPNGYLHIGHLKALIVDFGIADDYDGLCNLRFDDTNPAKEDQEFVDAIIEDIRWLGFEPAGIYYASEYFEQLYTWAIQLIKQGDAYVDDLSQEEMRAYRGTLTEPGKDSPYRSRSVAENLDLFERMRAGEFPEGSRVLRAKIDMQSPNIIMRDPTMYRILHRSHQHTGDKWCIYPMYDWAHGQSDSIEGVTHSLCSLEYKNHRPLYNWFLEKLGIYAPRQIEFARMNVSYSMTSKRRLRRLVEEGYVRGWDDPRMPTIRAMRRRGYPAEALKAFIDSVGLAKAHNVVEYAQLEHFVREQLNRETSRVFAVADPLKLVITNYPENETEYLAIRSFPQDKERTETRQVPFGRTLYIERADFAEEPPSKWKRMAPGREIRLFGAYFVTTTDVIKDEEGNIVEIHATYDPETRGGSSPDGRKVKGTIHWVEVEHALSAELRLYDQLFTSPTPAKVVDGGDFTDNINPTSLIVVDDAKVEPSLVNSEVGERFQFMRNAYFTIDQASTEGKLVFNRTITLRDSWAKKK